MMQYIRHILINYQKRKVLFMRKIRQFLTLTLAIILVFSTSMTAMARSTLIPTTVLSGTNKSVAVTDTGVYIDNIYYSQE